MNDKIIELNEIVNESNKISSRTSSNNSNERNKRKLNNLKKLTRAKKLSNEQEELKQKNQKSSFIKLDHQLCALDIGTSTVRCLIAESEHLDNQKNKINIKGFGASSTRGLRRGVVINIDSTVSSIQNAVKQAEEVAKHKIQEVYLSVTGVHIKSFNSLGVVAIRDKEVSNYDLEKVIEAAKAVAIPPEQELLHVIVQEYIIDGQGGIQQPLGISGVRLEVRVHLVTGLISTAKNLVKCANKAGLKVRDLVFAPIASSYSSLTESEKEQGVCLIDFGAATTDIAVFKDGAVIYSGVVGEGSSKISSTIAQSLKISLLEAERIKCTFGNAKANLISKHESFTIKNSSNNSESRCSKFDLSRIIEQELTNTINQIINILNEEELLNLISGGFVLVGEASNLENLSDLIADYVKLPVRTLKNERYDIAEFNKVDSNNIDYNGLDYSGIEYSGVNEIANSPEYANARGLLAYGLNYSKIDLSGQRKGISKFWKSAMNWVAENF